MSSLWGEDRHETYSIVCNTLHNLGPSQGASAGAFWLAVANGLYRVRSRSEERQDLCWGSSWDRRGSPEGTYAALSRISVADRSHSLPHSSQGRKTSRSSPSWGESTVQD